MSIRPAIHVDPPLARIPELLVKEAVAAFQTTLRDPQRFGKTGVPTPEDQDAYRARIAQDATAPWGMVHGSLLVNLASPNGRIRNASLSSLVGDLKLAGELGLAGVCFHVGYEKDHPDRPSAIAAAQRKLGQLLERAKGPAVPLLENCCEGGELGQTLEEMAELFDGLGAPAEALGFVLDTCHLHAAGFDLAGAGAGQRLVDELERLRLLERLVAFHLNDSQGQVGSHRDRHAPPGEGTIGKGLLEVVHHPALMGKPLVLEVSVEGARRGIEFLNRG